MGQVKERLQHDWYLQYPTKRDPFKGAMERAISVETPKRPLPKIFPEAKRVEEIEQLLTVQDVAKILSVHITTVYELIRKGDLRHQPLGVRGVRIPVPAIEEYKALEHKRRYGKTG